MAREKCRRFAVHLHQRAALLIFAALLGRPLARFRNRYAAFFRDGSNGFRERGLFQFHYEFENVAARSAAEAVINLFHRMHGEGRRLLLMKGAQAGEILPTFFQAHVFADHANDVRLLLHPLRK